MTRVALVRMCLILAAGVTLAAGVDQQLQVFRATANAVSVDATVQDRNRRPVTGLTAADFEIHDNSVLQQISDVGYARLPIDVTVALDVSYSVNGLMLERLRRGVVQLMNDFGRDDRLRLILFNSRIARTVDFTNRTADVEAAIVGAAAGGGTSLLDSISVAMVNASPADRRQLLVVFSDGLDSTSTTTPAMLSSVALRSRAAVVLVVPANSGMAAVTAAGLTPGPTTGALKDSILNSTNTLSGDNARAAAAAAARVAMTPSRPLDPLFRAIAASTGGVIVPTMPTSDLTVLFRRILADFRSAYVITYDVRGSDLAGYHTLEVKVKREGAIVNARRGYWY
jgi:VWFA-related protein